MQERRIHLAHQAMMLDDANKLLAINRQQIKAHGRMMCDSPQFDEESMGIHIGDVNIQRPPAEFQFGGLTPLFKALLAAGLGAGLLATGGVSVLSLASLLRPAANAAAPIAPIDIDIPWQWKDGKMQLGAPQHPDSDVTISSRR